MVQRLLTPRGLERRRQLIDCAVELFAHRGYDPTSVSDIVDGVGVGKGVFYWYFDSKEALLREILVEALHRLRRHQRDAIGDEPDPLRRIELGIRATLSWRLQNRELVTITQFAAGEGRFVDTLREAHAIAVSDIVAHVKDAIVEGQVRDDDPVVLAHALVGVTTHLAGLLGDSEGPTADDVAAIAVRFCLAGLRSDTEMYDS